MEFHNAHKIYSAAFPKISLELDLLVLRNYLFPETDINNEK